MKQFALLSFLLLASQMLASQLFAASSLVISVEQKGELVAHEGHFDATIYALSPSGAPIKNATIRARLWHSDKYGLFTSDIPYVDGIMVFDIETAAPDGSLHVDAMLPVPGTYVLEAEGFDPSGQYDHAPFMQEYEVGQLPHKELNGAVLLWFLFMTGFAGGYFLLSKKGESHVQ
ncbi:hypothetical protein J4441_04995 [Candidatus Micrarchaeota archaeon]|nr:hypothetical protein [Candidatus Micrarchaeota archaeon]